MRNTQYQLIRHDGAVLPIGPQGATIGRHRSNDIVVSDEQVSRQHARILLAAGKCWIRDENSTLGVYVNRKRVQGQQELKVGDILQIGNVNFSLQLSSASSSKISANPNRRVNQKVIWVAVVSVILMFTVIFMGAGNGPSHRSSKGGGTSITPAEPNLPLSEPPGKTYPMETASQYIQASQGGTVNLHNTQLTIPPGALSENTEIAISQPENTPDIGDRGISIIQLEPTGITFSTPAELKFTYEEPLTFNEEMISFYTFNEAEVQWEKLNIISHDLSTNQVSVKVSHFSPLVTIFNRPVDIAVHLPGKYLMKGDLIYALALLEDQTKFTWFPGHAALYIGTTENASSKQKELNGITVIESTPYEGKPLFCLGKGVIASEISDFIEAGYHIYMGARRIPGLSEADRTKIASFALTALKNESKYALVSQGQLRPNCYSCVGLTEAAYDDANKSIIPGLLEIPFILPLEQYIRTEPIDQIVEQAGKLIDFDYRRVYWDEYNDEFKQDTNLEVTGCPSNATCNNGNIYWQTTEGDIGKNITLAFSARVIQANGNVYRAEQQLTIQVIGTGTGNIKGQVVDAQTGLALPSATVTLDIAGETKTTDTNGYYEFDNVPSGAYSVGAYKEGYAEVSHTITVSDNSTATLNVSLPVVVNAGDIVITLSWGEMPLDLDAHLWLPAENSHHIYFENEGSLDSIPFAQLDVDDTNSYGPENITVRQDFLGRYTFAVHNYSGSPSLNTSSAIVTVVKDGRLVQIFEVPKVGDGLWWHVFDYDSETGNIIPRNIITSQIPIE